MRCPQHGTIFKLPKIKILNQLGELITRRALLRILEAFAFRRELVCSLNQREDRGVFVLEVMIEPMKVSLAAVLAAKIRGSKHEQPSAIDRWPRAI
jgi:hypothetical protein